MNKVANLIGEPKFEGIDPDLKLVNCVGCRVEMLGDSLRDWYNSLTPCQRRNLRSLRPLEVRIGDRPFCTFCATRYPDGLAPVPEKGYRFFHPSLGCMVTVI